MCYHSPFNCRHEPCCSVVSVWCVRIIVSTGHLAIYIFNDGLANKWTFDEMVIVWCFSNYIQLHVLEQTGLKQLFIHLQDHMVGGALHSKPHLWNLDELTSCDLGLTTSTGFDIYIFHLSEVKKKKRQELWCKRTELLIMTDSKCHMGKPPFSIIIGAQPQAFLVSS